MNSEWRDCVKDPPETGKKVLCFLEGDIYVAYRLGKYYVPMPFIYHYFSKQLCFPEKWSAIRFPEEYNGTTLLAVNGSKAVTLAEFEVDYAEDFKEFAEMLVNNIGIMPPPYSPS
jgi:hypothetical protein